eukprot:c12116_g1_i1.p1 GENE.c12116_g1_i1~~c12116_g1_i1.p1  ORF type:complete len:601 (+),score=55.14 c12116_g1_i1:55-1803(+)
MADHKSSMEPTSSRELIDFLLDGLSQLGGGAAMESDIEQDPLPVPHHPEPERNHYDETGEWRFRHLKRTSTNPDALYAGNSPAEKPKLIDFSLRRKSAPNVVDSRASPTPEPEIRPKQVPLRPPSFLSRPPSASRTRRRQSLEPARVHSERDSWLEASSHRFSKQYDDVASLSKPNAEYLAQLSRKVSVHDKNLQNLRFARTKSFEGIDNGVTRKQSRLSLLRIQQQKEQTFVHNAEQKNQDMIRRSHLLDEEPRVQEKPNRPSRRSTSTITFSRPLDSETNGLHDKESAPRAVSAMDFVRRLRSESSDPHIANGKQPERPRSALSEMLRQSVLRAAPPTETAQLNIPSVSPLRATSSAMDRIASLGKVRASSVNAGGLRMTPLIQRSSPPPPQSAVGSNSLGVGMANGAAVGGVGVGGSGLAEFGSSVVPFTNAVKPMPQHFSPTKPQQSDQIRERLRRLSERSQTPPRVMESEQQQQQKHQLLRAVTTPTNASTVLQLNPGSNGKSANGANGVNGASHNRQQTYDLFRNGDRSDAADCDTPSRLSQRLQDLTQQLRDRSKDNTPSVPIPRSSSNFLQHAS